MAAEIEFGEGGLDGTIAAVDDEDLGIDPRDGAQSLADLVDRFDLIMEDVAMGRAIAPHPRQHRQIAG